MIIRICVRVRADWCMNIGVYISRMIPRNFGCSYFCCITCISCVTVLVEYVIIDICMYTKGHADKCYKCMYLVLFQNSGYTYIRRCVQMRIGSI